VSKFYNSNMCQNFTILQVKKFYNSTCVKILQFSSFAQLQSKCLLLFIVDLVVDSFIQKCKQIFVLLCTNTDEINVYAERHKMQVQNRYKYDDKFVTSWSFICKLRPKLIYKICPRTRSTTPTTPAGPCCSTPSPSCTRSCR
jgi:hypothetical protein